MTTTPTTTAISHCEHEMLPAEDHSDWHLSHLFGLRAMISALNLLNQSAQDLADEVMLDEETFLHCVETLKMLKADESAALRRARFAARACDALSEALAARNDPRVPALMQDEINFTHVQELPPRWSFIVNDIRIDGESGRATWN